MPVCSRRCPAVRPRVRWLTLLLVAAGGCGGSAATQVDGGSPGRDGSVSGRDGANGARDVLPPLFGRDVGTSTPATRGIGEGCTADDQCTVPPEAECFETVPGFVSWPGGYCSLSCGKKEDDEPEVQCPDGSLCVSGNSGGSGPVSVQVSFCARQCDKPEECRGAEGYQCKVVFPGLPGYCAP